jgi:hypothetical protein
MKLWEFAKEALLHATPATVAIHERAASSPPPPPVANVATVACSKGADFDQPVPADAAAALARRAQFKEQAATVALRRPQGDKWSTEDWQTHYDEKAGIAEYDHEMSRQQAEKHAFACCLVKWLEQNQVSSDAVDGCAVCGGGDRANDILLAVGLGGVGQTWGLVWVHRGCAPAWRAGRIAEAVTALAAMGVKGTYGGAQGG